MSRELDVVPEDFARAPAVVAHPDDLEYGAARAVARWTRAGRSVAYVIVTDGEAGIDGVPSAEAGPVRQKEQVAVDVTDHLAARVNSLRAHQAYLAGLGRDFDPEAFVRGMTAMAGPSIGVPHAFGRIQLQGVWPTSRRNPSGGPTSARTARTERGRS